jgi:hypothetical protein
MDEEIEEMFSDSGFEDEEYTCHQCGKKFYMRVQDDGRGLDFDEGTGLCDICGKSFCSDCCNWHTYGGKYKRICETCFDEEVLTNFAEWYDIFIEEYCDTQCDGCPFFFKKGCMMILLHELVVMAFHTEGVKKIELERLQKRNRKAEKMWADELRNAGVQPKSRKKGSEK